MRPLVICLAFFVGVGCTSYSMRQMVGVDSGFAEEARRQPSVTRKGRKHTLNGSHGDLRPVQVLHGKASYYHDSLSGNLTANGEYYRFGRISAAHLTLPFCTVVRVIRKDTGHTVIVRVNDRGPYGKQGRILDLSRAAAEAIGMIHKGVVPIRAEVLEVGDGCTYHQTHRGP